MLVMIAWGLWNWLFGWRSSVCIHVGILSWNLICVTSWFFTSIFVFAFTEPVFPYWGSLILWLHPLRHQQVSRYVFIHVSAHTFCFWTRGADRTLSSTKLLGRSFLQAGLSPFASHSLASWANDFVFLLRTLLFYVKRMTKAYGYDSDGMVIIICLELYLDFINLFLFILSFFGSSNDWVIFCPSFDDLSSLSQSLNTEFSPVSSYTLVYLAEQIESIRDLHLFVPFLSSVETTDYTFPIEPQHG